MGVIGLICEDGENFLDFFYYQIFSGIEFEQENKTRIAE